jgi:hypothetical protein
MACSVQGRPKKKKARQMKSKVKSMLNIFFDIKGIIDKETKNSQFHILL